MGASTSEFRPPPDQGKMRTTDATHFAADCLRACEPHDPSMGPHLLCPSASPREHRHTRSCSFAHLHMKEPAGPNRPHRRGHGRRGDDASHRAIEPRMTKMLFAKGMDFETVSFPVMRPERKKANKNVLTSASKHGDVWCVTPAEVTLRMQQQSISSHSQAQVFLLLQKHTRPSVQTSYVAQVPAISVHIRIPVSHGLV